VTGYSKNKDGTKREIVAGLSCALGGSKKWFSACVTPFIRKKMKSPSRQQLTMAARQSRMGG
jgi:hypothetical protein